MKIGIGSCDECGAELMNGDAFYKVADMVLCEDCINDKRRILDLDEYTYQDFLSDKYERERHDVTED
jgi:hypothetical protein